MCESLKRPTSVGSFTYGCKRLKICDIEGDFWLSLKFNSAKITRVSFQWETNKAEVVAMHVYLVKIRDLIKRGYD